MQQKIVQWWSCLETTGRSIKGKKLNREQSACSTARVTHIKLPLNIHTHPTLMERQSHPYSDTCLQGICAVTAPKDVHISIWNLEEQLGEQRQRPYLQKVTEKRRQSQVSILYAHSQRQMRLRTWMMLGYKQPADRNKGNFNLILYLRLYKFNLKALHWKNIFILIGEPELISDMVHLHVKVMFFLLIGKKYGSGGTLTWNSSEHS